MALAPPGYLLLGNTFGPEHLGDKLFGLGLGRFPEFCPISPSLTTPCYLLDVGLVGLVGRVGLADLLARAAQFLGKASTLHKRLALAFELAL
jgi:hypothetical protein